MDYKTCPSCDTKVNSLWSADKILERKQIDFINLFHQPKSEAYCSNCGYPLFEKYKATLNTSRQDLRDQLKNVIDVIPVITANNPHKWDYDILSIVTSQSVSGTGLMSEVSASFSDMFGGQSDALGKKLEKGEKICTDALRYKAAQIGGNAIIATDIDYAEVGGTKGMLMVCMAGTAIRINNIESVFKDNLAQFGDLRGIMDKLLEIDKYYSTK